MVLGLLVSTQTVYGVDDRFIHGYVRAVLDQEFRLTDSVVHVHGGVVTVQVPSFGGD